MRPLRWLIALAWYGTGPYFVRHWPVLRVTTRSWTAARCPAPLPPRPRGGLPVGCHDSRPRRRTPHRFLRAGRHSGQAHCGNRDVLGYLTHASIEKNFDVSYLPWYIARPFMGLMLGLLFFFLFKGGLLATLPGNSQDLNDFGLAGIGGLVGLFSKNAIEKLREIFTRLLHGLSNSPGPIIPTVDGRICNTHAPERSCLLDR